MKGTGRSYTRSTLGVQRTRDVGESQNWDCHILRNLPISSMVEVAEFENLHVTFASINIYQEAAAQSAFSETLLQSHDLWQGSGTDIWSDIDGLLTTETRAHLVVSLKGPLFYPILEPAL